MGLFDAPQPAQQGLMGLGQPTVAPKKPTSYDALQALKAGNSSMAQQFLNQAVGLPGDTPLQQGSTTGQQPTGEYSYRPDSTNWSPIDADTNYNDKFNYGNEISATNPNAIQGSLGNPLNAQQTNFMGQPPQQQQGGLNPGGMPVGVQDPNWRPNQVDPSYYQTGLPQNNMSPMGQPQENFGQQQASKPIYTDTPDKIYTDLKKQFGGNANPFVGGGGMPQLTDQQKRDMLIQQGVNPDSKAASYENYQTSSSQMPQNSLGNPLNAAQQSFASPTNPFQQMGNPTALQQSQVSGPSLVGKTYREFDVPGLTDADIAQARQGGQAQQPVNTQTVQPNFMGQTPFGQPQTGQFTSTNPFVQAAQANAQGNIAGALQATAANRINQQTPYGSLSYQQTGTDAQGNPIWSANQQLSPELQQLTQSSLAGLQASQANPMYGINPGDTYSNAIMQRLAPQQSQAREALDAQLANQGIMPGSEA